MALNGVNMPLAVTGQEAVWQAVCKRLGMTDEQITEFLAGPPYLPFQWMGCLDGWGGPLPQSWIDRHEELAKKILARQRELGMTPVLQGFTGHVPSAIAAQYPQAKAPPHPLDRVGDIAARSARPAVRQARGDLSGGTGQAIRHGPSVRGRHLHRDAAAEQRPELPGGPGASHLPAA